MNDYLHIGVSGTRQGMSERQLHTARQFLQSFAEMGSEVTFHHGDCIGADAEFFAIAKAFNFFIVGHPPVKDQYRAHLASTVNRTPASYFDRNRDIVNESDFLVAAPMSLVGGKGGTWHTIKRAKIAKKNVFIIDRKGALHFNA